MPPGGVSSLPTNNVLIKFLEITPGRQERIDIQKSLEKSKPVVEEMEKRLAILDLALDTLQVDWKKAKDDVHLTANIVMELVRNQESKFSEDIEDFTARSKKCFRIKGRI